MNIRKLFIFISISAALTACVPQELTEEVGGNGAEGSGSSSYTGEGCSLELVIRGGDYGSDASTKGYAEDIKRIETNEFERLMLMIIDDTGKLVAYRVLKQEGGTESPQVHDYDTNTDLYTPIDFDNPASPYVRNAYPDPLPKTGVNNYIVDNGADPVYDEIHLEFKYEFPLHTATSEALSSERLTPGWYTILAIGNYNHEIFTGSGDDYGGTSKTVKNLLDDIYYEFNKGTKDGIDYFAPKKYTGSAWVQSWPDGKTQFPAGRDLIKFAYQLAPNSIVDPTGHGTETDKTDFMRSAKYDIIVSKSQRVFLNPGLNAFDMELKRTTARVEFEIENFSDRKMKIAGLEFCDRFASGNTWLFPHTAMPLFDWTDNDRDIFRQKSSLSGIWGIGAMDPQGPSAIIPFNSETVYQKSDGAKTFFDCLIYETRPLASEAVPYWYSVGVIPETGLGTGLFYSESTPMTTTTPIVNAGLHNLGDLTITGPLTSTPTSVSSVGTTDETEESTKDETVITKTILSTTYIPYDNVYVLKSLRVDNGDAIKRFLYEDDTDGNKVKTEKINSDIELGIGTIWQKTNYKAFFWKLVTDGVSTKLQNCATGRYIVIPAAACGSNSVSGIYTVDAIGDGSTLYFSTFDGTTTGEIGVKIRSTTETDFYLNLSNNGTNGFVGTYNTVKDPGNNIGLYQVSFKEISKTEEYTKIWGKELIENPLMAIEDGSSDAMPYYLNEINRNEHLKVRIGVSYNTFNQSLDFQVKSWKEKTNTFTFE